MDTSIKLHLGHYQRFMCTSRNALIVIGDFSPVLISKAAYESRHCIEPETQSHFANRLMAACSLAAASLSERESWGWNVTFAGDPHGFFCAIEPEGMICLREKQVPIDSNKIYVQKQKIKGLLMQSHFEPESPDPVKAVEFFFLQSEQTKTRIELDENNYGVLLQAMPGADMDDLLFLEKEDFLEKIRKGAQDGEFKAMHEFLIFYECRCDEKMIHKMISSIKAEDKKGLWDENKIDIECPRCGRQYLIQRN